MTTLPANKFELVSSLGSNALFSTYTVTEKGSKNLLDLYIIRPHLLQDTSSLESFADSFTALSTLEHPYLSQIKEVVLDDDTFWYTTQSISGIPLRDFPTTEISLGLSLNIIRKIVSATKEIHEIKMVHGDINPKNIVVLEDESIFLLNAGVAEIMSYLPESLTIFAQIPHPSYSAPEVLQGLKKSEQSDIYSIGMVLYELLTGILPFSGGNAETVKAKQEKGVLAKVSEINPRLPKEIDDLIEKALAWDPSDRFNSVGAFGNAIDKLANNIDRKELDGMFPGIHGDPMTESGANRRPVKDNPDDWVIICEECLTSNSSEASYCSYCWKDMSSIELITKPESLIYVRTSKRKRSIRKWAKRGALYFMMLSLVGLYFFDRSAPPGLLLDQPLSNISLSQGTGVWSTPRGGNDGIGSFQDNQPPPEGQIRWENKVATQILSSPSTDGKMVFITTYDKEVLALNSYDGSVIWRVKTTGPMDSSVTIGEEQIYVAYRNGILSSLDKKTGSENWSKDLDDHIFSWVVVEDGMLFALTREGIISSLDASTGATRWTIDSNVQFLAPPTIKDGILVAPGLKRRIFSIEARTGQTNLTYLSRNAMVGSAAISGNIAVLGGLDRHVRAIDITKKTKPMEKTVLGVWSQFFLWNMAPFPPAQSGTVWTKNVGHEISNAPAISGNRVIVTTKDEVIMALALSTGDEIWKISLDPDEVASSPTIVNSTFFVTTNSGYLKAFEVDTGNLLWKLEIDSEGTNSIAYSKGELYVSTRDGTIYGVK